MKLAKLLFTIAVLALYAAWATGLHAVWQALTIPQFIVGLAAYLPAATLIFFWAGMAAERGKKSNVIPELSAYIVMLLKPLAGLHNIANNNLTMVAVFLDPPHEFMTTKRLNRYVAGPAGRRQRIALFIRDQLLNWADPDGIHE